MDKKEMLKKLQENNSKYNRVHKNWIKFAKAQQIYGIIIVVIMLIILLSVLL